MSGAAHHREPLTERRYLVRAAGAVLWAALAALVLRYGGAGWPTALLAAAGAATFALWRTVPGAWSAFALLAAAALFAWLPGRGALPPATRSLLPLFAAFELFGLVTIVIVAWLYQPRRISRRLLGAWLASTGLVVLGIALGTAAGSLKLGSALVATGFAYRLGTVPMYAWAPLLVRHPDLRVTSLGALAMLSSAAMLLVLLSRMPDPAAAARAVSLLCVATAPWAAWRAARQWRSDRHCALSYSAVAAVSGILLAALGRARA